ncbi:hypothetical protein GF369_00155 [Candidatus Peregrinibacteria bacterium]|nr:hypothetical protein [Candidatus Peregrinibacteria bacterium]
MKNQNKPTAERKANSKVEKFFQGEKSKEIKEIQNKTENLLNLIESPQRLFKEMNIPGLENLDQEMIKPMVTAVKPTIGKFKTLVKNSYVSFLQLMGSIKIPKAIAKTISKSLKGEGGFNLSKIPNILISYPAFTIIYLEMKKTAIKTKIELNKIKEKSSEVIKEKMEWELARHELKYALYNKIFTYSKKLADKNNLPFIPLWVGISSSPIIDKIENKIENANIEELRKEWMGNRSDWTINEMLADSDWDKLIDNKVDFGSDKLVWLVECAKDRGRAEKLMKDEAKNLINAYVRQHPEIDKKTLYKKLNEVIIKKLRKEDLTNITYETKTIAETYDKKQNLISFVNKKFFEIVDGIKE